jgi:hypothetical protein
MLADDLALEGCDGVSEQRCSAQSGLPVEAGEAVGARWGGAPQEALVMASENVDCEAPGVPHSLPGQRGA